MLVNSFSISLDKKLIFLVMVVSVVALTTSAFLSFNFAETILKERVEEQLIRESSTTGNSISNLFDTRIRETQILANYPLVQNLVDELNQLQSDPDFETKIQEKRRDFANEVRAFREMVGYSIGFADVKIIGKQGTVFFSLGRLDGNDFSEDPRFVRGLSESFVELEPTAIGGRKMIVTTPIFEREGSNTEPIGVIIALMSADELDRILSNKSGLGKTGEIYLVNQDFLLISESRFAKNAAFNQKVDTIPVRNCFENNEGSTGLYPDYRGILVYGSSYCAQDLGLVLLAEMDESETFQPVLILQNRIFLAGVSITVGIGIVTFFLSKLVSRPIVKLRDATNEITKGNFGIRTNIKRSDEIGQLSSAFDSMAKKIQESLIAIKQREDVIIQQRDILLQFSDQTENYCVAIVDVIDSTKITAKLSDLESSKFYTVFLNSMAAVVRDFGGVVVKNIGDALLFYFPKTNSKDRDAFKNALECCLKISDFNKEINEKMTREGLPLVNYKISATYGSVRVAKIATSAIDDIFGSTVNRCAKINRFALPNGTAIGEALYQIVKSMDEYAFKTIEEQEAAKEYGNVYSVTRS